MRQTIMVVVGWLLWSVSAGAAELTVELNYGVPGKGAQAAPMPLPDLPAQPLKILPFTDSRPGDQSIMGEVRRDSQSVALRAKTAIAIFAANAFRNIYEEWGGQQAENAQLQLKGDVTRFALEDGDGYSASVGVRFFLSDAAGLVLWEGSVAGVVKGIGKVLTVATYPEIMNDVTREAYQQLLGDEKFRAVWSGKLRPPPGAVRQ